MIFSYNLGQMTWQPNTKSFVNLWVKNQNDDRKEADEPCVRWLFGISALVVGVGDFVPLIQMEGVKLHQIRISAEHGPANNRQDYVNLYKYQSEFQEFWIIQIEN